MKTMELEMERMEIIREVVETDSRELLQQLKDVVDAWRGKRGKVVEEEIPPCHPCGAGPKDGPEARGCCLPQAAPLWATLPQDPQSACALGKDRLFAAQP